VLAAANAPLSGQILPERLGDLPNIEPHLDWWAKVSEYLEHLYELYRYGKDAIALDTHLPGLDVPQIGSKRYHCHEVVACLYDTTRSDSLSLRRSMPSSTTILNAHEFGQSMRLVSILRRLFLRLPQNVNHIYSLYEVVGVLVYLGRINQTQYQKEFWRTWWESETVCLCLFLCIEPLF
jgi:hypothetical protein